MRSLTDEIYGYIITEKKEFSEQDILREFFKIESNSESLARKVVEPLLGHDSRFRRLKNHKWTAVRALTIEQLSLQQAPFVLFYIEDFEKA
jgi:hypothetical protein